MSIVYKSYSPLKLAAKIIYFVVRIICGMLLQYIILYREVQIKWCNHIHLANLMQQPETFVGGAR